MTAEQDVPDVRPTAWCDAVVSELRALRLAAGSPPFSELTRLLVSQRMGDGMDEHAADIAKSSVHDAFRMGRSRINVPRTRELVRVLGGDPALVEVWMERGADPTTDPAADPATEPPRIEVIGDCDHDIELPRPARLHVLSLMLGCLGLNLLGREFIDFFAFPIYLDMLGTAVAAIALGPWRGAAVGLSTNLVGAIGSGWISLPFALVNILGALVWGYGVRRWDMGRSLVRFFALNLITAVACSAVAVPLLLTLVEHQLRGGHDAITALVQDAFGSFEVAVAVSNLMTSSADKLISGFVALVIISALPFALRARVPLILANEPPATEPPAKGSSPSGQQ